MIDPPWVDALMESELDLVLLGLPLIFVLAVGDLLLTYRKTGTAPLADAITNVSVGTLAIMMQVALLSLTGPLTDAVRELPVAIEVASLGPGQRALSALVLFVLVDALYYWFHRMAHEMNFLWATHVVHHQSEAFNFSVSFRLGAFQFVFSWLFFAPLVLLGFPPIWCITMPALNVLLQFWVHAGHIGPTGPVEWVFNTPTHHRVHHAKNSRYQNKNYAGVLIVWDRLFGTFAAAHPEEAIHYGSTPALRSWNPVWANLHSWALLIGEASVLTRPVDRVRLFLYPPAAGEPSGPEDTTTDPPPGEGPTVFNPPLRKSLLIYVLAQSFFAVSLLAGAYLRWGWDGAPAALLTIPWYVLSTIALGHLLEGEPPRRALEVVRHIAGLALLALCLVGL